MIKKSNKPYVIAIAVVFSLVLCLCAAIFLYLVRHTNKLKSDVTPYCKAEISKVLKDIKNNGKVTDRYLWINDRLNQEDVEFLVEGEVNTVDVSYSLTVVPVYVTVEASKEVHSKKYIFICGSREEIVQFIEVKDQ